MTALEQLGRRAKQAEQFLRTASTASKDHGLTQIADALLEHTAAILEANAKDIANGEQAGMSPALLDRLRLNEARIAGMAQGMREIVALPDPVGRVLSGGNRPNGLQIVKVAVPLGVVAVIFEARPNVTVDAAALCLKSGQCGDSARRQGGDPFQPGDCCRDARRIGAGGASARLHPARGGYVARFRQ